MKIIFKNILFFPFYILNSLAWIYSKLLSVVKPHLGYYWLDSQAEKNRNLAQTVTHTLNDGSELKLFFYTPNWVCRFRAESFSTKEPETLEWIDKYGGNGSLFDIGANVGLYSIYYAATKKSNVYAFEPSVFNLALLTKNIFSNDLQSYIKIISNPLTENNQFAEFILSNTDEGGALSSFGVDFGGDGQPIINSLSYKTLGFSLDFLISNKLITEFPKMIKIDVDGIEHLILAGAKETLKNALCKTVLIEINDKFDTQSNSTFKTLSECGFVLQEKRHSEMFSSGKFSNTFNQIWIKP